MGWHLWAWRAKEPTAAWSAARSCSPPHTAAARLVHVALSRAKTWERSRPVVANSKFLSSLGSHRGALTFI